MMEMDALTLVLTHVEGCARAQAALVRTQRDTGMTDAEWWITQEPLLNKIIDPTHFPVATRVGTAAGQEYQGASSPEHAFRFGLDRILAGIASLHKSMMTDANEKVKRKA
jgi:hypothetical protein